MPPNKDWDVEVWVSGMLDGGMPEWFALLGLMRWPLMACAAVVVAIVIERIVFYLKNSFTNATRATGLADIIIQHKEYPKTLRDEIASQALLDLRPSFYGGIGVLRTVAVISPLLGLLGTILGIISAFKIIAAQTGPVTPNLIADGLWEAMLTTAFGMTVALPAILTAYLFKFIADGNLRRLSATLNRLSMSIELEKYGSKP